MTSDLALIAERRGGLAALLGLLLLEEPGADLSDYVNGVAALEPLGSGDPAIATEYERTFLRGVPLYESVFLSQDGQQGVVAVDVLIEQYERFGFSEHLDNRWRVAGPDHLGLQLRCLAHLCHEEATAWRAGTPDKAMELVESERTFVAHHIAGWAPVAIHCAIQGAGEGAYAPLLHAVAEHLGEEFDRLRPAPDLGGEPTIESLPVNLGPARLTRLLLAPSTCGTWLSATTIAHAARAIGAPWRPSDTRTSLRHVVDDAQNSGDLDVMLEPIARDLDAAIEWHQRDAAASPGNAANAQHWARTAQAMRGYLTDLAESGLRRNHDAGFAETITIEGSDAAALADTVDTLIKGLRAEGFHVR
jgi:TorA maturation chaperone TorD